MKIKSFKCNDNLSQYVDSMLFDSGECIAEMECELNNNYTCIVSLEVRGEVKVYWGDDRQVYKYPSDFPEALRELIEINPGCWDYEDHVYVDENNWFEYIYTVKDDTYQYSDGIMCEWDISGGTSDDIKKEMIEICEWVQQNA